MPERWRSPSARKLVKAIRKKGGKVTRLKPGRIQVTGPKGSVVIQEPSSETRKDLASNSAEKLIREETGLDL